jgi:hypothetical protein
VSVPETVSGRPDMPWKKAVMGILEKCQEFSRKNEMGCIDTFEPKPEEVSCSNNSRKENG